MFITSKIATTNVPSIFMYYHPYHHYRTVSKNNDIFIINVYRCVSIKFLVCATTFIFISNQRQLPAEKALTTTITLAVLPRLSFLLQFINLLVVFFVRYYIKLLMSS